ncbi:adenine-specific DNA methyltransferase [Mycoplasmopsis caviae]|uniref:site-specific DNA-methyltransferase (adenine-specific) n=1 Tax=Mycoplasmopsis caviae TaxID=55603 RepID=A0A3P8LAP2_9BACT|nr:adenine-specific DNA methyltransferase [Mycoplasmopsis caviae]
MLLLIFYGFNNQIRFNSNNKFNIPVGKQEFNTKRKINLKKFINNIQHKNVSFSNSGFELFLNDLIDNQKLNKDDFIYLDPPYLITDATYNKDWTDKDDKKLFEILDVLTRKKLGGHYQMCWKPKERKIQNYLIGLENTMYLNSIRVIKIPIIKEQKQTMKMKRY